VKINFRSFYIWVAIAAILVPFSCQKSGSQQETATVAETPEAPVLNTLTEAEKSAGWELLFNGSTLNGWKRYNADTIGPLWGVQDGAIICKGEGLTEGTANIGGSLTTTRQFGNFELSLEWKISPGGNSGVLYHVIEKPEYDHAYDSGPEYQLIDDDGWPGELHDAQKAGSNYDMYPAPAVKKLNPVGEWNTARIVYNNGHVVHWLNGEKTVEFDEGSPDFMERYKKSKWTEYPGWDKSKTGAIALQDHGANVYFRNIKIREIQ
jgi:3-keto-disaccharide hydrolase